MGQPLTDVTDAMIWMIVLVLATILALPCPARAQTTAADTAAVLLDAAGRLAAEGRTDAATELLAYIHAHYGNTAAGTEATRRLATVRERERGAGAAELEVWGTLYGLGLGAAIPAAASAGGPTAYGIGLLLGGPAGFLAARAYADHEDVTEGQARAITLGGTWGAWQGYGWMEVLGDRTVDYACPGTRTTSCGPYEIGPSGEDVLAAMIGGSLAGVLGGALIAHRRPITAGTATAVNSGAFWGSWYGLALALFADPDADGDDAYLTAALSGGDVGLLATALLAPGWGLSRERARLINVAGVAGLLGGAGIDLLVQPSSDRLAVVIPLATSVLGLALGAHWTRGMPPGGRVGGSGGSGGGSALLEVDHGRLALGIPAVTPILDRVRGGRAHAARISILHARF